MATAVLFVACVAQAAHPAGQKAAVAKSPTASKSAPAGQKAPAKQNTATTRKSSNSRVQPLHAAAARPRQLQPTADRYRQIQDALVAKGYLKAEQATGSWDQNSVDALKRFQAEQKLDATGKITSMSLIALGLGPKHDSDPLPSASNDARPEQH